MSIPYANAVLVTLIHDGDTIVLTTLSRQYGKSARFLIYRDALAAFINGDTPVLYDAELNNFLRVWYVDADTVSFRITWLSGFEQVSGHIETLDLPVSILTAALNNEPCRYLANQDVHQCPVILKPSAHKMIHHLNRLERRALSKALRDNWHWSREETISLYADWNNSFYFQTETISGGLCQHTDTITGKDRKPRERIRYSVHT